jgi:hypothetical protein
MHIQQPTACRHCHAALQSLGDVFSALSAAVGAADKVIELMRRRPAVEESGTLVPTTFAGKVTLQVMGLPSCIGNGMCCVMGAAVARLSLTRARIADCSVDRDCFLPASSCEAESH